MALPDKDSSAAKIIHYLYQVGSATPEEIVADTGVERRAIWDTTSKHKLIQRGKHGYELRNTTLFELRANEYLKASVGAPTRNVFKGEYKPPVIQTRTDVPEWSKRPVDFSIKTLA